MRVNSKKGFDELSTFVGDIIVNVLKLSFFDFFKKFAFILCTEGVISLNHYIVQNTQRPHVSINWTMIKFGYDFRGHVSGSSTKSINFLICWAPQTKPKVNQLDRGPVLGGGGWVGGG